jgi:glycerophosphoryl diester phosphodiesterase
LKYLIFLLFSIHLLTCKSNCNKEQTTFKLNFNKLIENLNNSESNEILVVAHRGDWRNAPENSLQAIQNCINIGVDIVEIDVQETKDGHLVLMHDKTLYRTTKQKGKVKDYNLSELKKINLLDGLGKKTEHTIPSVKEALLLAKGKIIVNLDKSYSVLNKCFKLIEETNTKNQVILKGYVNYEEAKRDYGNIIDNVLFMPQL